MISKSLKAEILLNKIEITQNTISRLIYEYHNIKDLFDIPDELIERVFSYELLLSHNFYYITEREDIIDFEELPNLFMMFGNIGHIVFKKNDFTNLYLITKLWVAKIKWFCPKNKIH